MYDLDLKEVQGFAFPADLKTIAQELARTGYTPLEVLNLDGWSNAKGLLVGFSPNHGMELIGDCPDGVSAISPGYSSPRWWITQDAEIPALYQGRTREAVAWATLKTEFQGFAECVERLSKKAAFQLNVFRYAGQGREADYVLAEVSYMGAPLFIFGEAYDLGQQPHHANVWQLYSQP